ncbi:MAG: orotate phosphoribosyltransferase [Candidatus Methylomirabilota bacterium]|nr:phosphoribosyltransferase family protein [Candidatus Methylomirabilis sp.]PWB48569.1 MAG: orotate phosphoribosyltransferase [candidate division NC10 bacterium]
MDAEILERINRGIILRTGAYLTNDHFVLPSGRHAHEYVEKALATTEPAFTEGLGDVIAKHFADEPIDLVLTTGYGAALLGHCVARAHPLRPRFIYANKQRTDSGSTQVVLPREFRQYFVGGPRVLIVEDIVTTGETVKGLIKLVKSLGGTVVGIGTLWRRIRKVNFKFPFFTLVDREFPTYTPKDCPMCRRGIPINQEFLPAPGPQKPRRVRTGAN